MVSVSVPKGDFTGNRALSQLKFRKYVEADSTHTHTHTHTEHCVAVLYIPMCVMDDLTIVNEKCVLFLFVVAAAAVIGHLSDALIVLFCDSFHR